MVSINKWFFKNAKVPLLVLGGATVLIQLILVSYIFWKSVHNQQKSVENLVTIANLAIEQKNRPVLESTFGVAIEELGAETILLCKNNETLMVLPYSLKSCSDLPKSDFFTKVLKIKPDGRPDYSFYFYLPLIDVPESYLILIAISIAFFVFTLYILLKIQRRFSSDILEPLENNLLSDQPIYIKQLEVLRNKIKEIQSIKEKEAAENALFEHKRKVAHNIRSLVQTLRSLQEEIQQKLSLNKKDIFNDVVEGITDLLLDLSENERKTNSIGQPISDEAFFDHLCEANKAKSPVEIETVIKSTVKQKQYEFRSKGTEVSFECDLSSTLNYRFIDIVEIELKSIISNLINNSVEAEGIKKRHLKISGDFEDGFINLRIKDNASGIPEDFKKMIFDRGATKGKHNGSGYGLYHAKLFSESWNGEVSLENSSKEGTEFLIKIPSWEPVPLKLQNDSLVVILDDDKFIHDTWNTKFNKWTQETGFNINLKEFYNPKELIDWISNNEIDYSKVVFLIDNDLGAEFEKGSNVINSLGIADLSFLVTNRYDDKHLVQHCKISKIRLMPKPVIFNLSIQEIS